MTDAPGNLVGYTVYRAFKEAIVLSQTIRQGPDQIDYINLLLRIRNGTTNQQTWLDINKRCENDLSPHEKSNFEHNKVITLMVTSAEVNNENHIKRLGLSSLGCFVTEKKCIKRRKNPHQVT